MRHRTSYREGKQAYEGEPCPYPEWMLGQRCAWLAGYHEAKKQPPSLYENTLPEALENA